jgi:hypothetical protein
MLEQYEKVLVAGCGTCVAVCLAGGEKEARTLALELQLIRGSQGKDFSASAATVERQCDREFLGLLRAHIANVDAVVSLACGAGIQFLAQMYPEVPVFPGVDTSFIGVAEGPGVWSERCRSCNQCYLALTGGICPITMCAKSLLNGPCGGPQNGKCEVSRDRNCAWVQIIERMEGQTRSEVLDPLIPPRSHDRNAHPGQVVDPGLRHLVRTP